MRPDSSLGTGADTAPVEEPLAGASASVVHRRRLAFAQTAVSGGQGPTNNSLLSGATLRGEGAAPSVPERIGRFMVLGPLGSGGMGVVVEAYDPELDRKVAIKLLKGDRGRSDSQARLLREAQAMARVSHPNVVQVYDVGVVGEQVFVAMELIVGETLGDWLEGERRPWREVVRRFIAAGRGLAAAHAVDLVHRDFKPDNVLSAADGRVCVADFGLARGDRRALPPGAADSASTRPLVLSTLTATGALMGTPFYMSPEQHRGEAVGPRSDIFSFAVALFEGLYGRRPFEGDTMPALARNVLLGESIALPADHGVPSWLDAAVRRGFAVDPKDRYADFAEFIVALDRDPSRQRRRWLGAGALTLGAALLGGAIQGQSAEELCSAGTSRSAELWDDSTKAALRDRLATLPAEERAAIEPRVIQGLGDYASAWADLEHDACTGHRQGDRSDALFDRQQRCLDRRYAALGSAIQTIREGDEATLRAATMIIAKLPPLAYCGDQDALLAEVAPPEDPATRTLVNALRDRATQAEVLASAGRPDDALTSLDALTTEAIATAYTPLVAEVALAEARIAVDTHDGPRALAALDRAFLRATEAGADALAIEALARSIFVRGVLLGDPEALDDRAHAEALSAHVGRRDLAALLANNSGAVLATTGDLAAARQLFRSAIDLSRGDPLTRPIDYANGYLKNLAQVSDEPREQEQLFAEVAERLGETLSPVHPVAVELDLTRAMRTTDPAQAAERLRSTCPKLATPSASTLYLTCVQCYHRLGHIEDELGHSDAAAASLSAGLACLEGPITEDDLEPVSSWRALLRGQLHLNRGDHHRAALDLAEARRWMEPHRESWWVALLLADVDLTDGRRLALTDPTAAAPRLEAAIAGFEPLLGQAFDHLPSYGLARAQTTLAQVLTATASTPELTEEAERTTLRRRSAALLDAAQTYYKNAGPSYAPTLHDLTTWRRLNLDTPSP